jgi:predicted DNA binding CopG/RHH family protein
MKRHYDFSKGRRGAVFPIEPGKTRITIRIDNEVLDYFRSNVERAGGGNYQTLMNEALREHIRGAHLEKVLRQTVREELRGLRPKRAAG